jgi:hypothetical protein
MTQFIRAETRYQASKECPWAGRIVRVDGGFMCFEHEDDYRTWKRQR